MLEKTYQPALIEKKCYEHWEAKGYFSPQGKGDAFCMMLPPPNVTGSLHMGHGFGFTLMDIIVRYQRMTGKNTLWQPGTDHAGIATQMVVERKLNLENKTRHDLGRENFIDKIWAWKQESGGHISQQLRRLGASLDWSRERFTLDESLSFAVREVFIKLYEEGLIYRGKRLVNWDPVLLTAISDLEVINHEEPGFLWHIRYPICDSDEVIVVATTRPETLFGDVAVAINPNDERYQPLIGKQIHLPLTNRTIPIIADNYVDPAFGTGCVKITPAHDFNDYAVGTRHHLEMVNILTPTAHLNDEVPKSYAGLERLTARKKVVEDLQSANLIEKIEPYIVKVPRGDRSHAIIEPYLTNQWYVKSKPLAEKAIQAVENGDIRFIPSNWDKTFFQWMNHIEDWCISRQLWWGHRIPVWYDTENNSYVGHHEEDVRKRYQLKEDCILKQDEDVLDTWFSSALWPFSTLGWPENTKDFKTFFPTQVLVTGFDIIFFWVARMIMMSLHFTGKIPFSEVYITGLIRDAEGHKMSKSKGNVLDPIDLIDGIELDELIKKRLYGLMQPEKAQQIEKTTRKDYPSGIQSYGTDALRFTFCSFASYTREIRFDLKRLEGYKHFCNKLWNAARYVLMNVGENKFSASEVKSEFSLPDYWIRSRLQKTINHVHQAFSDYRFDYLAQILYDFTWNEFCDWYLELSKPILTSEQSSIGQINGTRQTLIEVLETLLRLLHPIMPFITESLWQQTVLYINQPYETIMLAPYPQSDPHWIHEDKELMLETLRQIIIAIRIVRSEKLITPSKRLTLYFHNGSKTQQECITEHEILLKNLAKVDQVYWGNKDLPANTVTTFVGELEIFISLEGIINLEEEQKKLKKELEKLESEKIKLETKLNERNFIQKAPAAVVEKEKNKLIEINTAIGKIRGQLTI